LIGLGLMGRGIATCLLVHGHNVIACETDLLKRDEALLHIEHAMQELSHRKLIDGRLLCEWKQRIRICEELRDLHTCPIVLECIREDLKSKVSLFKALEEVISENTILASNTSSLPITLLQRDLQHPERLIGMHWGEPAQILRYLEIIPGEQTSAEVLEKARNFATECGKEPTVLKRDIRGFLSNRLMYAMIREAFLLVESGVADIETVDRSFRNDIGWWATIAGPFRWMDLTGIPAYAAVMEGLLPELSTQSDVPALMKKMVDEGALGIQNQKGFYPYTRESAEEWERRWVEFTYEIEKIARRFTP